MKILLVDEDGASLDALGAAFRENSEGAEVVTATSAAEGFEVTTDFDRLDVLITAALMAPQDGFHLASALRARFPELRVAYLSKMDLTRHFGKVGSDIVFYKPVDVDALVNWASDETVPSEAVLEGGGKGTDDEESEGKGSREGARIGDYELLGLHHATDQTETYEAVQRSVERHVAFTLLRDELREGDPEAVEKFLEEVRAKASVVQQHIAPVYEAHEEDEALFYTRELVEGRNLDELTRVGAKLSPTVIVSIIRVVAESFEYLNQPGRSFAMLLPKHVFLGGDNQARLVNLAVAEGVSDQSSQGDQIGRFAGMIEPHVKNCEEGRECDLVARLFNSMKAGKGGEVASSWTGLKQAAQRVAAKITKENVPDLPDMERRAKVTALKKRLVRVALIVGSVIMLGLALRGISAMLMYAGRPEAKEFDEMVRIPAGRFQYQDEAEPVEMEAFWIDEYEVTIAQYAQFLKELEADPSAAKEFDHAEQPEGKAGHLPPEWKQYYSAAQKGGFFKGQPVDLNCPITLVDWWDADAYARWKNRRLPTEKEWEKAARGRSGGVYPWGDEFIATRLNSSQDYSEDSSDESAGTYDGYVFWSPVDAIDADVSPYSVKGTAGNVSEWTASWTNHLEFPDRLVPVKRGGSFATQTGYELTRRRPASSPEEQKITLGFRTASSIRPIEVTSE